MDEQEFLNEYTAKRKQTDSVKWDNLKAMFGTDDLLPLWVADMDFKAPKAVREALQKRIDYGVFGYSLSSFG